MSLLITLYPKDTSEYKVGNGQQINHLGRAYCRVDIGDLAIQTDCWEHMQRLVDALNQSIVNAQAGEAAEAIKGDVEVSA